MDATALTGFVEDDIEAAAPAAACGTDTGTLTASATHNSHAAKEELAAAHVVLRVGDSWARKTAEVNYAVAPIYPLPTGTRVSVKPYGAGTYESYRLHAHWSGLPEHTIAFDGAGGPDRAATVCAGGRWQLFRMAIPRFGSNDQLAWQVFTSARDEELSVMFVARSETRTIKIRAGSTVGDLRSELKEVFGVATNCQELSF